MRLKSFATLSAFVVIAVAALIAFVLAGRPHKRATARESVRTELARLQGRTGLTLTSYYRGVEFVRFADRSLSQEKELLPTGTALEGVVSHDGTSIAFVQSGPTKVGIVRRDGSGLREYPEVVAFYGICWSDDRSRLALSAQNLRRGSTPPNDPLLILDLTSKTTTNIDVRAYVTSQCWSPDGKKIVYTADNTVRVYDDEQKQWQVLARGSDGTWSSDGAWIAFRDNDDYYAIRPSGEERKFLFHKEGALTGLWWSPDSRIVAYVSRADSAETHSTIIDVGITRLRVRRLEDNSEDWVAELSDVYVPRYVWVENASFRAH